MKPGTLSTKAIMMLMMLFKFFPQLVLPINGLYCYVSIYSCHYSMYSVALLKISTYDRSFELGHRQWFLAGQQWLFTLCKQKDHLRETINQVPAGQSSPAGFGNITAGQPANDQLETANGNFRNHVPKYSYVRFYNRTVSTTLCTYSKK